MADELTPSFESHRDHLFAIAYRMTGSAAEAEDIVQETFVRWQKTRRDTLRSERAWLSTVVTRLSLNHLKSARVRRTFYFGPWLPEPLETGAGNERVGAREHERLADSLSLALLVVLESLGPAERAVFVLRDVFDYEYHEIAAIVAKSEANCRRILARARTRVAARRPRFDPDSPQREKVFEAFTAAVRTGDVRALLDVLAEDVTFVSDGGGRARALPLPIVGARRVARLVAGVMRRFVPAHRRFRRAEINGLPGIVGSEHGRVVQVLGLGIARGRVARIYIITNPAKLRHLQQDSESIVGMIRSDG